MSTEKKTVTPRMFSTLIAQFLTNQGDLQYYDFDCTQAAIGMSDLNLRLAAWINNGCQIQVPEKAKAIESAVPDPTIMVIDVTVDPNKTMPQLIEDGKYGKDRVNANMTEANFPMGPIPKGKELVRVCFHRMLNGKVEIDAARTACGLEPVTSPAYLLTVGAKKPDLQKKMPIVDIDSVWLSRGGNRHCPCLLSRSSPRKLDLRWSNSRFHDGFWFLALRNIQP